MEVPEKNRIPIDLIARYLNGEANTDDIIDLEQWKAASGENVKVFEEYIAIWKKTGQVSLFTDIDIENEWNVFLESTDIIEKKSDIPEHKTSLAGNHVFRLMVFFLAGLALCFTAWYTYQSLKLEKLVAGNEVINKSLPDGSQIALNKNSKLVYAKDFKEKRNIELVGEAFFEVVRDDQHPFIVKSDNILVEAVGTSFNMSARKDENIVRVVVESGRVAVYNEEFSPLKKDIIKAGEKINFSKESGIRSIQKNTDPNYNSWKTGILVFDNSSLQYISRLLEDQYQIRVQIINPLLNERRVTMSFKKKSPDFILQTIAEMLDLELIKTNDGFMINDN